MNNHRATGINTHHFGHNVAQSAHKLRAISEGILRLLEVREGNVGQYVDIGIVAFLQ